MIAIKEKTILTDCDGVILDWEYAFGQWMHRHGYKVVQEGIYDMDVKYGMERKETKRLIRMFNESAQMRSLAPLRDSIKYVKKLHEEHGYVFHAITSLSNDQYAQHLRGKNLRELFGESTFERYVYLDTGADKDEVMEEYRDTGCYWVEDKPENVDVGINVGCEGILMSHQHNSGYKGAAHRVQSWKEIYHLITG